MMQEWMVTIGMLIAVYALAKMIDQFARASGQEKNIASMIASVIAILVAAWALLMFLAMASSPPQR